MTDCGVEPLRCMETTPSESLALGQPHRASHSAECPSPVAQLRQQVSKGFPLLVVPGATLRPQPCLQRPDVVLLLNKLLLEVVLGQNIPAGEPAPEGVSSTSFPHLASWGMPRAHPRQHVSSLRPLASLPAATLRPQPSLQSPGPNFEASILPHERSWPKPKTQPLQHVVKGLPERVTPGATGLPQPTLQQPFATCTSPWVSCNLDKRSAQASGPILWISSRPILSLSWPIQLRVQPCLAAAAFILDSLSVPRCLSATTIRSTWRLKQTSP
mmetsp:Transcript_49699/g.118426  ORF Transcript_49699/g.118426 Transcript_49699/m.118426 type:complete len:271 (-) Transcript_49699:1270-2082(-)